MTLEVGVSGVDTRYVDGVGVTHGYVVDEKLLETLADEVDSRLDDSVV